MGIKISELPSAGALTGTELVPLVQTSTTKQTFLSTIRDYLKTYLDGFYALKGANTDITSLASPAIGDATATTQSIGDNSTKVSTTAYADKYASRIQPVNATVSSNAMTITVNPTVLDFRNSSLTNGTNSTLAITSPISTVISSGSTAGTINAIENTIIVAVMNVAGTAEVAWTNIAGGQNLSETGLISTTAEGGAGGADSNNVWYSTTSRSNMPYRIVGAITSTQATAGTWATAPSKIQGMGGNALGGLDTFGVGQTYQNVTGSRSSGVTYYNVSDRAKLVSIIANISSAAGHNLVVNGSNVTGFSNPTGSALQVTSIGLVPPRGTYSYNVGSGGTIVSWFEYG